MAVVVQRMVAPRAAGVMFTRSPVTGDRSVVAIEGTWGLGSALVSGDVTPDSFIVSKVTGEITTRRVSPKIKIHRYLSNGPRGDCARTRPMLRLSRTAPSLTDDEIRALAAIGRRVEAHYGAPQDIEWALLDGDGADAAPAARPHRAAPVPPGDRLGRARADAGRRAQAPRRPTTSSPCSVSRCDRRSRTGERASWT